MKEYNKLAIETWHGDDQNGMGKITDFKDPS
jgi:hypothetical protein